MRFTWLLGLLGRFGIQWREDYYYGLNTRPGVWNEDFARFKAANSGRVKYNIEAEGIRCLEAVIDLCDRKSIQVLLVYSPEYYEMQTLEPNSTGDLREIP